MTVLLAVAALLGLVVWLQNLVFRRFGLRQLRYDCYLNRHEVFEGEELRLIEVVRNQKPLPLPWLKSELATSPWLDFAGSKGIRTDRLRLVSSVFMLRGWHQLRREWQVRCRRFGWQGIEKVLLVSNDLLGNVTLSQPLPIQSWILVLPRPYDMEALPWEARRLFGKLQVRRLFVPDPFFMEGVSEYSGLEPLRSIHWYASAREQRLMVHRLRDSQDQSVAVLLNLEPRRSLTRFERSPLEYADAIRLAATAFDQTLASGVPVELITNSLPEPLPQGLDPEARQASDSGSANPMIADILDENLLPGLVRESLERGWYRSRRASGRTHVYSLLRVLATLQNQPTVPFATLLEALENELVATDLIILSFYIDPVIEDFVKRQMAAGRRPRIGLLSSGEDEYTRRVSAGDLDGVVIPLYRVAHNLREAAIASGLTVEETGIPEVLGQQHKMGSGEGEEADDVAAAS
ncbi:MAG: DUF58 domain-containing protein [Bacillota bacterium]|nr:DUF58 domain-containing protein [Bacillota bacterium]